MKLSTLSNTRRKMNSRLVRQSGTIEDLMYSSKNYMTVEEALAQFDYIFKQLLLVHQEYHSLLEDDEKLADVGYPEGLTTLSLSGVACNQTGN